MAEYPAGVLLKRLFGYIGSNRKLMGLAIVAMVIGSLALALAPKRAGDVMDYLSNCIGGSIPVDMGTVIVSLLIIAGLYVLGQGLSIVSGRCMVTVSRDVTYNFRKALQVKLHRVPINYMDTHPAGDVTARLTNDMTTMETLVETDLPNLISNIIVMLFVLVMMVVVNPMLALAYVLLIPVAFLMMRFITTRTRRAFKEQQSSVGSLNGYMGDVIGNHALIRSYNMEGMATERFGGINLRFDKAYVRAKTMSGMINPLSTIVNNLGYICTAVIGASMIIGGTMTIGGFLAFLMYGQMLSGPLSSTSTSLGQVQSGFSAMERLLEVLDAEEEPDESDKERLDVSEVRGEVRFEDVVFGYVPERTLFQNVNFTAEPGTVTAIVGPSGAGKTTVINLLMRFYDIQGGRITLDGRDTMMIDRDELRKAFGMVLQESWVFGGTVAENIGYGREGATREEIEAAARMVGCDGFIRMLPQGYDTRINEENAGISAGEKQLLVLARTVLSDPRVLILDEATSNMDTRTEALVTRAMEEMMKGRTTFIIAHRLFTIRNADKIIFMRDGGVREVGSHEELMALDGEYAEMYRSMSS